LSKGSFCCFFDVNLDQEARVSDIMERCCKEKSAQERDAWDCNAELWDKVVCRAFAEEKGA
jgi:hypothetical protein